MIKKYLRFNLIYALIFILVLVSMYKQWPVLNHIVRPCITLSLLLFLYLSTRLKGRFHKRLFTGLVFALAGDSLLMLHSHNSSYFSLGIAALILCHFFYIGAFYLDFRSAQELDKKGARFAIISSAIMSTAFYFYLRPHLEPLIKLPMLICTFIMALLMMMAAFRNQRVNSISFKLILAGVFIFISADAVLAQTYLIQSFSFSPVLIITFYAVGQYLIVVGGAERKLIHTQTAV